MHHNVKASFFKIFLKKAKLFHANFSSQMLARHGYVERRAVPLTMEQVEAAYSQEPRWGRGGW